MQTIDNPQPPVHWAKQYSTEIGLGLLALAVILFAFAISAALTPSHPKVMDAIPVSYEFAHRPMGPSYDLDIYPTSHWYPEASIPVLPGKIVNVTATGQISWSDFAPPALRNVGPNGINWKPEPQFPNDCKPEGFSETYPCGAFLMKVSGKIYVLGEHATIKMGDYEGGILEFLINTPASYLSQTKGRLHFKLEVR